MNSAFGRASSVGEDVGDVLSIEKVVSSAGTGKGSCCAGRVEAGKQELPLYC